MSTELLFHFILKKRGIHSIWLSLSQSINFPGMRKIPSNKNVKDKELSGTSIIDFILYSRQPYNVIHTVFIRSFLSTSWLHFTFNLKCLLDVVTEKTKD